MGLLLPSKDVERRNEVRRYISLVSVHDPNLQDGDSFQCLDTTKPLGIDYRGTRRYTLSGTRCQHWSQNTPHSHQYNPSSYPNGDLKENYCRNPDESERPWCYTIHPYKRWEYCFPVCTESHNCPSQDDFPSKIQHDWDHVSSRARLNVWKPYYTYSYDYVFATKKRVVKIALRAPKPEKAPYSFYFDGEDSSLSDYDYNYEPTSLLDVRYTGFTDENQRMEWTIPCHLRGYYDTYKLQVKSYGDRISQDDVEITLYN